MPPLPSRAPARTRSLALARALPRARSLALVLSLALLPAACAYARAIPIGEPLPPRPPNCQLAYKRVSPADAQAQWRQVGDVCASPGGGAHEPDVEELYEPGEARDKLTEQACRLGGEIVSPVGLCSNGKHSAIEFGVYVAE